MESVNLKTLADLKRFLAKPGATVQLVRHDWTVGKTGKPALWEPRAVAKLQTNAVAFKMSDSDRPSWLYFDNAKRFRFEGEFFFVLLDSERLGPMGPVMQYRCALATP